MKRCLCPFHKENTPSCMLYEDGYFCHGCGKHGPLSDLKGIDVTEVKDAEPEDLEATFRYIDTLPLREVRGLMLPSDDLAYYICWPGRDYYKKRFFEDRKPKYIGATGHTKPWFWANNVQSKTLVVVEGELNALSVAQACPELTVVSPGGAGDFSAKRVKNVLKSVIHFDTLLLLVDADQAGAIACIEFLGALAGTGKKIKHCLMARDANEILCDEGKEKLRSEVSKLLEGILERGLEEGQVSGSGL